MTEAERKLIRFAAAVLDEHKQDGYPGDVDGGWLQDKATELGVLVPVRVTEPCSEEFCACADCDNIPGDCYRYETQVEQAMAEADSQDTSRDG